MVPVVKALPEEHHVTVLCCEPRPGRRPSEACCDAEGRSSGHQRGLAGAAARGLQVSEGTVLSNIPGAEVLA